MATINLWFMKISFGLKSETDETRPKSKYFLSGSFVERSLLSEAAFPNVRTSHPVPALQREPSDFLTLIQVFDGPEPYVAFSFLRQFLPGQACRLLETSWRHHP